MTNFEGARSRVQKAEALTPSDPAVWENQPAQYRATWLTVLLSSSQYSRGLFSLSPLLSAQPFSFHSCQRAGRKVGCQVEIIH